jgi:hypothetical protein
MLAVMWVAQPELSHRGGAVPVVEAISLNFICAGAFSLKKRSSILASALHILELRLLRTGGQRIRVAKMRPRLSSLVCCGLLQIDSRGLRRNNDVYHQ